MTTPPLTPEDIERLRESWRAYIDTCAKYAAKEATKEDADLKQRDFLIALIEPFPALLDAAEREQRYRQALHIAQPWLVKMQETCSDTGLRYAIMGVNDAIAPEPPELSGNTEQLPEPQKCETCNGSGVK